MHCAKRPSASTGLVTAAGLAAEYVEFEATGMVTAEKARHNLLRPEAMEAMFVLWRVTQKEMYREWAWEMFLAFERNCKVPTALCLMMMHIVHLGGSPSSSSLALILPYASHYISLPRLTSKLWTDHKAPDICVDASCHLVKMSLSLRAVLVSAVILVDADGGGLCWAEGCHGGASADRQHHAELLAGGDAQIPVASVCPKRHHQLG